MNEDGFLQAILANPKKDALLLIYSDWLVERGDPVSATKAEFLRVTVQVSNATGRKGWKKTRQKRLQELAASLDADWLAVVSRLPIENCLQKRTEGETPAVQPLRFEFLCDQRWEDLRPTEEQGVRFCEACRLSVYYCDTIGAARRHAWQGHCIAVDLGVMRRDQDLEPERMWLGRPSAETLRRERERMEPDPVSAERERRKQEKRAKAGAGNQ
jgi:uncharacterized protein (TIGR02996 family)